MPATAQAAGYRIVADPRAAEASTGRLLIVVERDGDVVATYSVPTATLRTEAGRRLRVTLRRRPLIEFREPFSPPPEREPDVRLIDLPLLDLIPRGGRTVTTETLSSTAPRPSWSGTQPPGERGARVRPG